MSDSLVGPASHAYFSERLRLHYVDWGNEGAPPMLMVHGGRDHCRNWDWIAREFRNDYHIIAPDLRGHGDSAWMVGGNYSMSHYVYDLVQLIHQKKLAPLTIVGHSLGGSICMQYAGAYPETVKKLVVIEGFMPPISMLELHATQPADVRMRNWVAQLRDLAARLPRRYATSTEAEQRMREANPRLTQEQAHHLTVHGINQNEDGSYSWKFDNYVRALSPYVLPPSELQALWSMINCPVLMVSGSESWEDNPKRDGRAKFFKDARLVEFENAGHWVHHDQLAKFIETMRGFLKE